MIAQKAQHTPKEKARVLQRKLYRSAKKQPERKYGILYDKVYRMDILKLAWKQVRKNRGSAGVDGRTIDQIIQNGVSEFLEKIQEELKEETYRPQHIRRAYIPKDPQRKKMRPLGIPTVKDRVVQAAVKIIIEPIFEADFQECSYGFRPERSPLDAIGMVRRHIVNGYTNVIDMDLKSYFDTIPHDKLLIAVKERVTDPKILRMLRRWLKAGIMEEGKIEENTLGTQQGGVISPLLSNIYLNLVDRIWVRKGWESKAKLVRFADDLVILVKGETDIWMKRIKAILVLLGLTLNEEKTQLVRANQGFDFLGMHFRRKKSRKGKPWCYFWPSQKAMKKKRQKMRGIIRNQDTTLSLEEVVEKLNPVIKGWGNYFCWGNGAEFLLKIDNYIRDCLKRWLRRKHQQRGHGHRKYKRELFKRVGLYQLSGRVKYLPL